MKKIYIGIYAVIAILVIVGTIFGFIYGIIRDAEKGKDEAARNFNFFAKSAIILAEKDTFADPTYIQKLTALAEDLDLKAFVLSSEEKQTDLSWFKDPNWISYTRDTGFSVKTLSPFIKYFNGDITVKTQNPPQLAVKVSAAISTVKPDSIYTRSRTVFFAALTVFLLTFIIILLQSISASGEKVYADIPTDNKDFSDYLYGESDEEPENRFARPGAARTPPADFSSTQKEEKSYTLKDLDNLNLNRKFPYENGAGLTEPEPKAIPFISEVAEKSEPQSTNAEQPPQDAHSGLYSPITGITCKEHFTECLEMELKRAASSEQDLALIVIRLKEFSLESLVAKKIAALLIGIIKFKDRIFEFGEDGFAAILQDTNLDTAMKISEEIFKGIKKIMDEYHIFEPVAVGITTRTSRLLSSDRLIEEAAAAAGRAMSAPDEPIVAFKVNPEQYRRFISETM